MTSASRHPGQKEQELAGLLKEIRQAEADQDWGFAASLYQEALRLAPSDGELLLQAGNAFWFSDQPGEAFRIYGVAAEISPGAAGPYLGLGNALRDLNRFEEADRAFRTCRSLSNHPLGATNHASLLLGLERYEEAFELAERRFDIPGYEAYRIPGPAGWPTGPGELLVWTEQGLGDILQYLRWIPLLHRRLSEREITLVLEVEASLERLVSQAFALLQPAVRVRAKATRVDPEEQSANLGLLSLPHRLGEAPWPPQPQSQAHYLRPAGWREREYWERPPRIGITWASGKKEGSAFQWREYHKRSLEPAHLKTLLAGLVELGCAVVPLQQGPDREWMNQCGVPLAGGVDPHGDFADTAEWIESTDLVISVDTSVAHLTGALGHPGWILLPWSADPRWLRDRTDTPWYPSLQLFRQPASGQWEPVIEAVLRAAGKRFATTPSSWS